ncbi:uncharacterized protein LOC128722529 [Anopheles nili]|uniref:uncharacterized protein LOC128722529 n=1 Tax=Anopheles nili TaxID=185578 RepID=UPI00237A09AE|nr:uncharacterized protein LOC128722529 [Anopheles nili]
MKNVRSWWSILVLFDLLAASQALSLQGDNVCYRYESYTETETIPRNQTVQVLTRQWCLEFIPRCTFYQTEIKEVFVKQNVTRTRRVEFCCEGYQERRTGNGSIGECHPICRGGCIHGECQAPNVCNCMSGFSGKHCLQRCRNGTWGVNCRNRCHCQNYAHCDTKTGHCRCTEGWMGKFCEIPCPEGTYGTMCVRKCKCNNMSCHPQTGVCMPIEEIVMFDNITRTIENAYSSESTERISAEQWIKVENETNSTVSKASGQMMPNATYAESYHEYLPNNTEMSMVLTKGHLRTASNESVYELVTTTSRVEITFIDTAVKKVEDPATLNNATDHDGHDDTISGDNSNDTDTQLVYLESENHPVLLDMSEEDTVLHEANERQALVTISCLLITLSLLLLVAVYLKRLNRKALAKSSTTVSPPAPVKIVDESVQTGSDSNRSSDPLPDLPHVTYTRVKPKSQRNGSIEHYDIPANNSFIHRAKNASPYNYNFPAANLKVTPRRYSLEHIYDEIQYPPLPEVTAGIDTPDNNTRILEKDNDYSKTVVVT